MKVLFCSLQYSYGKPEWGFSHEYLNLYDALQHMSSVDASFFSLDERMRAVGRDAMNAELIRLVQEMKPDVLFCQLFTDELKKETISFITRHTATRTINWFGDDHWRFHIFSKQWAPLFSLAVTTDASALPLYAAVGARAVVSQWAVNQYRYHPGVEDTMGSAGAVTFVGQRYGIRSHYYAALQTAGKEVHFYGAGWPGGLMDFESMLSLFAHSAVNLNFTESPHGRFAERIKLLAKIFIKKESGKFRSNIAHASDTIRSLPGHQRRQIKGRIFEVIGSGGFLLSGQAPHVEQYYRPGRDLVLFDTAEDLVEKVSYYMAHREAREKIARSGYKRTLAEHTYEHRFKALFSQL